MLTSAASMGAGAQSVGSDEVADTRVCQRYVQSYERSERIPQGLMAAISFVESGREIDEVLTAWPWTINAGGQPFFFDSKEQAVRETRSMLDQGVRSIDVGCMQINLRYHPDAFRTLEEAFDPATNVAYAAKLLTELHRLQGSWPKAVERYHSGEGDQRDVYRDKVMLIWKDDARRMIMNAVRAEDTDTPYHKAQADFARGKFLAALKRYDAILSEAPEDRTALMGRAMSLTKLGRDGEAISPLASLVLLEADNPSYLERLMALLDTTGTDRAIAALTGLAEKGAISDGVYAELSRLYAQSGQIDKALMYAAEAARLEPTSPYHQLNAGVLSDQLGRQRSAMTYYSTFLDLYARNPVALDIKVDDIRKRVHFLRAQTSAAG